MNDLTVTFLIGAVVAALLAHPIYKGLIALKSRQTVSQYVTEHAHKQGTPTMGGLIILAGGLPALAYWTYLDGLGKTLPTIVLVISYALIGFVDDFVLPRVKKGSRGFGWIPKLILQIGFACLAVWLDKTSITATSASAFGVSVFLILFFANAYNFSDGLDWLSGSIFLALGLGLAACVLYLGLGKWIYPLAGFLGALLPFMALNRPPAKIFMGDVGSMAIGGLIGLIVSDIVQMGPAMLGGGNPLMLWLGLAVLSVVMIIELVPPPLQILSVKLLKRRLFPFTPIHHAFQRAGWPELKIVGLFFGLQVVGSVLGFWLITAAAR